MKIKATLRFYITLLRMAKIKNAGDAGENVEKEEYSFRLVGLKTATSTLKISLEIPDEIGHSTT